jgi:phenylalanyl-tRNA synthetase alpha subunit
MALQDFLDTLDRFESEALAAFNQAANSDSLEEARVRFLGAKNGVVKDAQKLMTGIAPEDRKSAGVRFNAFKNNIFNRRLNRVATSSAADPQAESIRRSTPVCPESGPTSATCIR